MKTRTKTAVALAAAGLVVAGAGVAEAAWAPTGSGAGGAASTTVAAPAAGNAATATSSSVTVTVTAKPSSGPVPSAYRVDRTSSTAPGAATGVCTIAASSGLGSCTDSGLQPATAYAYAVYSLIGSKWVSSSGLAVSGSTSASPLKITSANGNSGNTKMSFTGSGATNGQTVTVTVCATATFPCASPVTTVSGVASSTGAWTTGNTSSTALTAGQNYYAQAGQPTPALTSSVVGPFQASSGSYTF